mgnify:CR=1 FL=1
MRLMNPLRFSHAFVREISRSLARCELEHLPRQAIDLDRARRQHAAYAKALESAGVRVSVLPEAPDLPDSCFVEDPVLVLDEMAVICRPARANRAPEAELMAREVSRFRPVFAIVAPGTLEGGDVLRVDRTMFVGRSSRTNQEGITQLEKIVARIGYRVTPITVRKCLHLKSGVTSPAAGLLLANPEWIDLSPFHGFEVLAVPAAEPWGANTLPVNGRVLVVNSAPQTADRLRAKGLEVQRVDVSELQKAEAGLTCLSVLYHGG